MKIYIYCIAGKTTPSPPPYRNNLHILTYVINYEKKSQNQGVPKFSVGVATPPTPTVASLNIVNIAGDIFDSTKINHESIVSHWGHNCIFDASPS